jgi:hypothetical protein
MPERSAEVTILVKNLRHKNSVMRELSARGFAIREFAGRIL